MEEAWPEDDTDPISGFSPRTLCRHLDYPYIITLATYRAAEVMHTSILQYTSLQLKLTVDEALRDGENLGLSRSNPI